MRTCWSCWGVRGRSERRQSSCSDVSGQLSPAFFLVFRLFGAFVAYAETEIGSRRDGLAALAAGGSRTSFASTILVRGLAAIRAGQWLGSDFEHTHGWRTCVGAVVIAESVLAREYPA